MSKADKGNILWQSIVSSGVETHKAPQVKQVHFPDERAILLSKGLMLFDYDLAARFREVSRGC